MHTNNNTTLCQTEYGLIVGRKKMTVFLIISTNSNNQSCLLVSFKSYTNINEVGKKTNKTRRHNTFNSKCE